jgi:hypothetical protein
LPFDPALSASAEALIPVESAPAPEAPAPEAPQAPTESNTPTPDAPSVDTGATPQDSHLDIDLSGLDPELAAKIRAGYLRQSDYTRKTQEVAQLRQFMEQSGLQDLTPLQEAWSLASTLTSDPLTVYNRLSEALAQRGLIQPATAQPGVEEYGAGDEEYSELPPHVQQKLQQFEAFQQRFEQAEAQRHAEAQEQAALRSLEAEYTTQVDTIKRLHQDYEQEDIDNITAFAFATGGNMIAANEMYQSLNQRTLSRYLNTKAAVPNTVTVPNGQGHAEIPTSVKTIAEAGQIARQMLAASGDI